MNQPVHHVIPDPLFRRVLAHLKDARKAHRNGGGPDNREEAEALREVICELEKCPTVFAKGGLSGDAR